MSKKPTKAQVRAQAVAERQRASAAAAKAKRNRMLLWGALAVVVVLAIVVAVVASGGSDDSANATKWETAAVEVTGTPLPDFQREQSPDPAVGDTIPTLEGKSIYDGSPITIGPDAGDGEPQMIVFLAHWCPHCRAEVPRLVELADDGVFDGVKVSAVATGTNDAAVNYPPSAWLQDEGWEFPVMADTPSGTAGQAYGLTGYPYFVLVNADGTVAGRGSGELPPAQIRAYIEALQAGEKLPISSSEKSSSSK